MTPHTPSAQMPEAKSQIIRELGDPKLRALAVLVVKSARLAAIRAVAHQIDPRLYPLPQQAGSLEEVFWRRFITIHPAKQVGAIAKVQTILATSPEDWSRCFGLLAGLRLDSPLSVEAQGRRLDLPGELAFAQLELARYVGGFLAALAPFTPPPTRSSTRQKSSEALELRVHRVRCLDQTTSFLGLNAPADTINLAGIAFDERGQVLALTNAEVGHQFVNGSEVSYDTPRSLIQFDLQAGTAWPKTFCTTFVLTEPNLSDHATFMHDLVLWIRSQLFDALTAAIGPTIGEMGGPVGALIGMINGWILNAVCDWLSHLWEENDWFKPISVALTLPVPTMRWAGKPATPVSKLLVNGHGGNYQIWFDWHLTN